MRSSLSLQVQNTLLNIARASEGLTGAQSRLSTGKRILKASDDVPGTNRSLTLRSAISTTDQLANNILVSLPLLKTSDAALGNVTDIIKRVQVIATGASSETQNTDLTQLDSLMEDLADIANTRYMDQYIFSGTATNKPTVTAQAGPPPFAYTGDAGVRKTQVLSGVSIPTNMPGETIFNFDGSAGVGTTDMFTMISDLRDMIQSGDYTAAHAELANIKGNLDNALNCRSRIGSWEQRMSRAQDILTDTKTRMQQLLSDVEDADLPEAVIQLKTQENVYQAALSVSSRMLDLSLASLNYS